MDFCPKNTFLAQKINTGTPWYFWEDFWSLQFLSTVMAFLDNYRASLDHETWYIFRNLWPTELRLCFPKCILRIAYTSYASSELCEFIKTCHQFVCSQYIQDNCNDGQSCHTSQHLNNTAPSENIIRKLFFIVFIKFTALAQPLGSHCPGCPFGNRCLLPHLPDGSQGLPARITKD